MYLTGDSVDGEQEGGSGVVMMGSPAGGAGGPDKARTFALPDLYLSLSGFNYANFSLHTVEQSKCNKCNKCNHCNVLPDLYLSLSGFNSSLQTLLQQTLKHWF